MGWLSNGLFQGLGAGIGSIFGSGENGRKAGEAIGSFLPFKHGGKVSKKPKKPKAKTHYKKATKKTKK